MVVIPGCWTPGRSGMEVHFSNILRTFLESNASASGAVVSCGRWWILGQSYIMCSLYSNSAFSTDGVYCAPYFVQPVLELRLVATSQTIHRRLLFP